MSKRYQGGFITASYNGLKVPNAPTIGTATGGNATASVTFTAPTNVGGGAITGYTVISSPGSITGTGTSSPITVSGLSNGTAYTFTVVATNAYGTGPASAASNSVTPLAPQQIAYTAAGTYTFVAPAGLSPSTVAVVCVGGGGSGAGTWTGASANGDGGGGGGLGYKNAYAVTAGNSYTVVVGAGGTGANGSNGTSGGDSYFVSTAVVKGGGGVVGLNSSPGTGGTYTGDGGGNGGNGASSNGGGGGAGGYAGSGGTGGAGSASNTPGTSGSGGGGGGGRTSTVNNGGSGGGGVGIWGQGTSGTTGASGSARGNSGSTYNGSTSIYSDPPFNTLVTGSGSGGHPNVSAGSGGFPGAVRIIWSTVGTTRAFPSTNTGDL